jgi:hypothetical protein
MHVVYVTLFQTKKKKLALFNFKDIISFQYTRHLPTKVNKSKQKQPHNSKAKLNGKHNNHASLLVGEQITK